MKRRNFLKTSVALITPTIISGNPIHIFDNNHPILNPQVLAELPTKTGAWTLIQKIKEQAEPQVPQTTKEETLNG